MCPVNRDYDKFCGSMPMTDDSHQIVVKNIEETQTLAIDTRGGDGEIFGAEETHGFDFSCRYVLYAADDFEFGHDESIKLEFLLGDGEQEHISTMLMFYQVTFVNEETGEEESTETWEYVTDLSQIELVNSNSDTFELITLMDYDEDIVLYVEYTLTPGNYEEDD